MQELMPQNVEAEQALLGCILTEPDVLNEIIGLIKADDFYSTSHQILYSSLIVLYGEDTEIDIVTLATELKKTEKLADAGGITYLTKLKNSVLDIDSKNVKKYAQMIKESKNKRDLIKLGHNLIQQGYDDAITTKTLVGETGDKLYGLLTETEEKMVKIDKAVEDALFAIEKNYTNGGGLIGVSSGFADIDRITSGLQKGDFIIVAARPSMGKTTLAINIGQKAAKTNKVAVFSLEMSKEQLVQKMLSAETNIDYQNIRMGKLTSNEWESIAKGSSRIASRQMHIDDTAGITTDQFKAKCKKLKNQTGLDVAIIDYLQLMECKAQSREQEISKTSRNLKKIAKELGITIIALSQLSRAPEQRADHRPILSDLRESGSIEQDADTVMFLYRDEYYDNETEDKNIAECIFAKNRNGRVGTVKLAWLGQYQKFCNLDFRN